MDKLFNPSSVNNYLQNRANVQSRSRGKDIYDAGGVSELITSAEQKEILFKVASQSGSEKYVVKIKNQADNSVFSSCTCPYDWAGICKHEVAAIFFLLENLMNYRVSAHERKKPETIPQIVPAKPDVKQVYDQKETTMDSLSPTMEQLYKWSGLTSSYYRKNTFQHLLNAHYSGIKYETGKPGYGKLSFSVAGRKIYTEFKQKGDKIITSCECNDPTYSLCMHKAAAWLCLTDHFGNRPLEKCQDYSKEKDMLLKRFGFGVNDKEIDEKFEFILNKGTLTMRVKDYGLLPLDQTVSTSQIMPFIERKRSITSFERNMKGDAYQLVYLLETFANGCYKENLYEKDIQNFCLYPMVGKLNKAGTSLIGTLSGYDDTEIYAKTRLSDDEKELVDILKSISPDVVDQFSFSRTSSKNPEDILSVLNYLYEKTSRAFRFLKNKPVFELDKNRWGKIKVKSLIPVHISDEPLKVKGTVAFQKDMVQLDFHLVVENQKFELNQVHNHRIFIKVKDVIYLFDSFQDIRIATLMSEIPVLKVKREGYDNFLQTTVIPLQQFVDIDIQIKGKGPVRRDTDTPASKVYLQEEGDDLTLKLLFDYNGTEVQPDNREQFWFEEDGNLFSSTRDNDYENEIIEYFKTMCTDFEEQDAANGFYIPINHLLKNNQWFNLFEKLKNKQIEVFGFKDLKKIRQNPNRPIIEFKEGSGIDWFELKTTVSFGEQKASLKAIRDAILRKDNFVKLSDGSLGMLPADWLKKYSTMFQVGEVNESEIKLSKFHFSVIDELYESIDNEAIFEELAEKRKKIRAFKEIKNVAMPGAVKATLRDYQLAGLHWMNFLDEFKFGGCLADDMGLGKTLQVITFFTHLKAKEKKKLLPNLVVVPKTLIFNWKSELEKFSPTLSSMVYFGSDRDKSFLEFKKYDLVITTYGMVRSDIMELSQFTFNYIVLDESQAIKNPGSQVSKAVRLLKGKNRLIMTGTPVENNTYDLYSQFDFVNPGLLGNREFFKVQFATPIDKFGDQEAAKKLSKIVKPFVLRRTKEQVAKELPDKTETILYCEMEKAQKNVYDSYKDSYKQKIMEKIASEGINKSRMLVLEGLTKLRQICDAPSLINNGQTYTKESVKLKEIVREITENTGKHKILIFSQFLKMLGLIREQLEYQNIGYEYFDGQTQNREERIRNFQQDDNCRVFLISLKAGGVGLNLTEADYVYLIDPWWNPAVEQQAIDRTHRIGQNKKVFAYKLICKNTIEEKILQMQEKKKKLSEELISAESGFVKNLDQNDIEELFN